MAEMTKNLNAYRAILRETTDNFSAVKSKKEATDIKIGQQKEELRQIGDKFLDQATDLSNKNWRSIASESRILRKTSSEAQGVLLVVVVLGTIIGIVVLYIVPRPILATIAQLLNSAQRVAVGDLSQPIEVSSRDELGRLAATFDHMRTNLFSLVHRIQKAAVQITTTVNEIQAASYQQSQTATEQAGSINEFSTSLTEIAQGAERLADTAESVAENTESMGELVRQGNTQSSQTMASMNAIGSATKQTSDRIKALNDQMDTINESVTTISGVADQTTLLSLNAAIEASKAGEMGKGFSVVATEIRRLSDRSIDSAGNITGMVRDIQRAAESSVVSMDKSSEEIRIGVGLVSDATTVLEEISRKMEEVRSQSGLIAEGVAQQSRVSRESQTAVSDILSTANLTAQAARQSSSAAYELNAMAAQLSDAVAAFRL